MNSHVSSDSRLKNINVIPMFEYSKHDVIKLVNILFPDREVSCDKLGKDCPQRTH